MLSASDKAFLKAIGVSEDVVAPASKRLGGYHAVYETCPECGAKRHRFLDNGMIFCLSCAARKQRDQALRDAQVAALIQQAYDRAIARADQDDGPIVHRGFEIRRIEGTGWCFRRPGELWTKAHSRRDALISIERLVGPLVYEEPYPFVPANKCRECGEPCGELRWCGPCGKAKFL